MIDSQMMYPDLISPYPMIILQGKVPQVRVKENCSITLNAKVRS